MKKLFLIFAMALCTIGVFAKKQVVYVEYFTYSSEIGEVRTEQVRNMVIASLATYQHLQVVDVDSESSLRVEDKRRSGVAADDETSRTAKFKQLGANYIVQGLVSAMDIDKKVDINRKGEEDIDYSAIMSYTIKVIDCETGTLLSTDLYKHESGNKSTPEKCVQICLQGIPKDVHKIVTKNFKLSSIILDSEYESKKGKLQKCYINLGEDDGVLPGTVFAVKQAIIKVGRVSWVEIGELVVESIIAGDLSLCKVKKGAAEINTAIEEIISIKESDPNNAHDLIVVSKSFNEPKMQLF